MIEILRNALWSWPLLVLLMGVGIYQTWRTSCIQFAFFGWAKRGFNNSKVHQDTAKGDISPMQALMTALAGAIGTGNITGIATAVVAGGFGALFWMWVVAFFGMATSYSETVLAVKFRHKNSKGEMIGGPMVTLQNGLRSKKLAIAYALFGTLAGIGYGMVQSNSVVDAVSMVGNQSRLILGIVVALISAWVIIGGVKRIGQTATALVPFMAALYLVMSGVVLASHYDMILPAFKLIFTSAFTGQAAVGGFLGSTVMLAMQNGAQYGIFANEAGLGSFAIASASAKTDDPQNQGFLAMSGVFLATMVVCTITGLVLAVTSVIGTEVNGQLLNGSPLALSAFGSVHDTFPYVVIVCLCLFAFTTILAWAYYGEKCWEFLFGLRGIFFYKILYTSGLVLGSVGSLAAVWSFAHLMNGLMVIPNLIAIVLLSKQVMK